jgi:exopolysaccharide transport family protein
MSATENPTGSVDVRKYVRALLVYKWLVLAVTVVVGTLVALYTLRQPKVYQATTIIEFDPNPPRPLGRDVQDVADPIGGYWLAREFFSTQNLVLGSRAIAERVVRRLGLHEDPTFWGYPATEGAENRTEPGLLDRMLGRDAPSGRFEPREPAEAALVVAQRITVEPVKDTRLVRLHVRDENPERAAAIADAFADVYIEKTLEDRMGSTVNALEWLGGQLDTLRREVETSELALHQFKEDHNVLSVSMEDRQNLVAGEINSFSEALTNARQRRIEVAARVSRLQSVMSDDPLEASGTVFDERSALNELRTAMREKLAERERLSARLGTAHPQMRALDEELNGLREQLAREVTSIVRNAEADLREIRAVEGGLRTALEQAHEAGLELNLREIEYQRLARERENKTKLYELVLQRTTETDLTRMIQTSFVRLVDRAQVPTVPVSPNVKAGVTGGVMGGLVLGVLLALGLAALDRRLRGPEAVEELGVTVLGVIPHVGEKKAKGEVSPKRRRRGGGGAVENPDLIVHEFPMSTAAECVRTVRTNLTFMAVGEDIAKVFVITSSQPREGKTTVASNLAASMAQSGKRVLLVDTDLRKPRVHAAFKISRERGVSTFIIGEASFERVVQTTIVPGLDVIPAGPVPPNPAELLHSPRFRELVDKAREKYDVVIFDSPPLGAVTDAAIVGPQVDGVLVVVKSQVTTRDAFRSTLRQLGDVGARVLGAVVNDISFSGDGYYGKGYYYRRYGEYYATESEGTDDGREAAE